MRRSATVLAILTMSCGDSAVPAAGAEAATTSGPASTSEPASTTVSAGDTDGPSASTGAADSETSAADETSPAEETAGSGTTQSDEDSTGAARTPELPPANAGLDYQLGGAYPPPAGVEIVSRDRSAAPAAGLYNICYVNGFQTQPHEEQWWLDEHPDLLLRDANGEPFIDPNWDEMLLDITTEDNRTALTGIVGGWIEQCGEDGYDAVEIDNLDTYSRSDGMISQDNAVDFMQRLSSVAHTAGMAIAQKNSTEIVDRQAEMGTDFAVAEGCNRWDECADYKSVYGDLVFVIEYRVQDFDAGCAEFPELSTVLRDVLLAPEGSGGYVYDAC